MFQVLRGTASASISTVSLPLFGTGDPPCPTSPQGGVRTWEGGKVSQLQRMHLDTGEVTLELCITHPP